MSDLKPFYQNLVQEHAPALAEVKQKLIASSSLRLLVFLVTGFGVYFFFENTKLAIGISVLGIAIFLYLVSRHIDLKFKRNKLASLKEINEIEIQILNRDFHKRPDGIEFKNDQHFYSQDVDLFGKGSFYQYVNRTTLSQGSETLAALLTENTIHDIALKQEAIKELSSKVSWRQEFSAIASLTKTEISTQNIDNWLKNYRSFLPPLMRYLPILFSGLSVVLFVLYFMGFINGMILLLLMAVGFLISGLYAKKISRLRNASAQTQSTFEQYNKLIAIIEETHFEASLFKEHKKQIVKEGKRTSSVLKEFSRLLGNLDQNNNVFYLIFGNGFFLRGLATSYKIEQWIATHRFSVNEWFEVIAFFDAYISLATFAFNHQEFAFPELVNSEVILKSKAAGHPLVDPKKSVLNDFKIDAAQFFIVTGANMAGKSTFLRTISLQILMANVGLPVCAKELQYNPIKLITSMRTNDSLTDDESYFFSELKRLKFIVEEIQKDQYFIVLDEILKGTNSTDKANGSRKFLEKLVQSKSTGLIATHDLSLCEVAKHEDQVENHYFDAEIIDDELHFDYTFKSGICQNMNASFLLKKMKIVD